LTKPYILQQTPVRIPVPGNKLIEEFIGHMTTNTADVSVAHMIAPPGWSEPPQCPAFDEITIMIRGKMQILIGDEQKILEAGQVILCRKDILVQYSNPFDEENEYWAVCFPAFTPDTARREP
jgi:ethanolamine utilization protein EutQ (cupin superfamily)